MPKSRPPPRRQPSAGSGARRYHHPVPDANDLLAALGKGALGFAALCSQFKLQSTAQQRALRRRLDELVAAGVMRRSAAGEFGVAPQPSLVVGTVSAHRDGYGFLVTSDGSGDVYLPAAEMRQLLDGDKIAVRIAGQGPRGQRAGSLVEVLERGRHSIVGRYQRERGQGVVVDSGRSARRYLVPEAGRGGAEPGQFVKLEITVYPGPRQEPEGKVLRVLGNPDDDPAIATDAALEMFGLPGQFPAAVREAAVRWGAEVRASDKSGRVDLRELPLVTIDGADARDFDDAVFTEARGSGWRLVVAIADVSHYVRSHDALDEEAARRGTSAYFPDRVVPMLPEQLSNGLCSLNPGVDRLCMVADMTVDRAGEVSGTRFYRAVMRSHQRLVYEDVQAAHDGERGARQRLRAVLPQLQELYGVYAALLQARERRGALDLELPEVKIELGAHGGIERISLRQRTDAHRLIEECMIAANVQAARFLKRHRLPTLYRVHAGPAEEKFEALRLLLQSLGIKVSDAARSRTRDFNAVLRTLRARPDYPLLATAVLRSMAQAVYQPENIGHFGLALSCYTHFTSPIRRYPDLLVHRGIGHVLDGLAPGRFAYYSLAMAELGERSSARERRADEAARHVEARYKCAWMRDRVGEVLPGVITGVTGFGIFVMLDELAVDGLVHVSSLGRDYFQLQPGGLRLVGERSGREFSLGVRLRVRVVRVDVDQARIDLALADEHAGSGSHPPANRRRHASTLPRRPR